MDRDSDVTFLRALAPLPKPGEFTDTYDRLRAIADRLDTLRKRMKTLETTGSESGMIIPDLFLDPDDPGFCSETLEKYVEDLDTGDPSLIHTAKSISKNRWVVKLPDGSPSPLFGARSEAEDYYEEALKQRGKKPTHESDWDEDL